MAQGRHVDRRACVRYRWQVAHNNIVRIVREHNKRKAKSKRVEARPLTVQEVLQAMLQDARREVGEAQRDRVACWNGLGGIAILMAKLTEAGVGGRARC